MVGLRSGVWATRWRFGLITAGSVAMLVGAGIVAASGAQAAAGCRVEYSAPNQWPGGFNANVEVTNLGDPINGWNLVWTWPSGQRVNDAWNATITPSTGTVTATNVGHNAAIPTNGRQSFSFSGAWSGTNTAPTSFALNGVTCNGAVGNPSPSASPSRGPSAGPSPSRSLSQSPSQPTNPGNPMAAVAAMQPGWNLGNSFDAVGADETAWGNPRVTQALINNVRAQGFNSIRIPVTWSNHHGAAPSYTIDAAWLARIREVVNWSLSANLYVMINLHHDSWQWIANMPGDRTGVLNRYNALWTQLAAAFRDASPRLTFESVNEPQFTGGSGDAQNAQLLNELNTSFHRIVRQSGGNNATRLLVLPTLHTSADQPRVDELAATFTQLGDRNLIATVHFYGYWPFSVNVAGGTRFDATVQQDLTSQFDRVFNAFVSRGIPVIIGEYGLLGFDRHTGTIEQGEKLKFFEFLGFYARSRQITTQLWDNGQHLGRTSLQWSDPELIAQIKSSWAVRSGTASADQVYVPRTGTITGRSLTLNLNGTSFQALRQGNTNLANGADYTVSGSQLTLTAAALTRLVGSRAYGVNATLHAHFSSGVPWRINVITFDPPVLSNASGSTSGFAVPTQFRGDQLATMEARYADGSFAGPHNWTSFKEFDVAFAPNSAANNITLTAAFFNEVNNAARVTLTFHFWSGTTVTYFVTRNGTAVTGSTT